MKDTPITDAGRTTVLDRWVVWGLWFGLLSAALWYIAHFASSIPLKDDLALVPFAVGDVPLNAAHLWEQHNEHRIPLAKWILTLVTRWSSDFRTAMVLSTLLLGAASAALILVAGRLRGRTSFADILFPLLWLHLGHGANLLMGFQLALVLPVVLVTALLMSLIRTDTPSRFVLLAAGFGVLLLPLNGGAGAMYAAAFTLSFGALGLLELARGRRAHGTWALTIALATGAFIAVYISGLAHREELGAELGRSLPRASDLGTQAKSALQFLALSFGPSAQSWWPWSGVLILTMTVLTLTQLVRVALVQRAEGWRACALIGTIGGVLAAALAVGWSRGGAGTGFAHRYVILAVPLPCALVLTWSLYLQPRLARHASGIFALVLALSLVSNSQAGLRIGRHRRVVHDRLVQGVERGLSTRQLARQHWKQCASSTANFARYLATLRAARWAPYEHATGPDEPLAIERPAYPMLITMPTEVDAPTPPVRRRIDGRMALVVPAGSRVVYDLAPGTSRLRGLYGIPPNAWETGPTVSLKVTLESDGKEDVLFERALAPSTRDEDRGSHALDIELPVDASGRLVLSSAASGANAWSFWSALALN